MNETHFYVIWRDGGGPPTVKHQSVKSAKQQAERLARGHPGEKFHVLELVDTCEKTDVQWATGRLAGEVDDQAFPF